MKGTAGVSLIHELCNLLGDLGPACLSARVRPDLLCGRLLVTPFAGIWLAIASIVCANRHMVSNIVACVNKPSIGYP